jgi:hypothetical protein
MKTPQQFKNIINDLDLSQIRTENLTPEEAKQNLARLAEMHMQMREMEVNLNLEIHALRSQYQGRMAAVGINPRRHARMENERHIEEERDSRLAPYEEVRDQVRSMMAELAEKQASLEKLQAS